MAYAFQQIKNSLDANDQDQKANIFAPTAPGQNQDAAQVTQGAAPTKTSTEGGDQLGGAGPAQNPGDPAQAVQSSKTALQRNVGKTQNPQLLNTVQKQVTDTGDALQKEADSYVQNAKNTSYNVKDEDIDKYVAGDQAGGAAVNGLLGRNAVVADPYASKTDLSLGDVDKLQSDAGMQQVLRHEGGSQYTAGMGAFDLAALRRTEGFDQIRKSLADQKKALQDKEAGYETTLPGQAQTALDANLAAAKAGLTSGLNTRADALTEAEKKKAADANAAQAAAKDKWIADQAAAKRKTIADSVAPGARLGDYINDPNLVDASKFYTSKDADWKDMISGDDASQFNRIMAALGRNDPASLYTAGSGGPTQGLDPGYEAAIMKAASGRRQSDDVDLNHQINSQIGDIAGRVNPAQEQAQEVAEVQAALKGQYGDVFGQAGVDPNQFGGHQVDWHDLLTDADVAKLSPLAAQLGAENTFGDFTAGKGAGMGSFDKDSYQQALASALQAKRQEIADAAASNDAAHQEQYNKTTAKVGGVPVGITYGNLHPETTPDNRPMNSTTAGGTASKGIGDKLVTGLNKITTPVAKNLPNPVPDPRKKKYF